jgi:hypothetical protein
VILKLTCFVVSCDVNLFPRDINDFFVRDNVSHILFGCSSYNFFFHFFQLDRRDLGQLLVLTTGVLMESF